MVIAVFTWVIALAFFAVQYTREKEYKVSLLNTQLQQLNKRVISDMDKGIVVDNGYVTTLSEDSHLRLSVLRSNGDVVFDTRGARSSHRDRAEFVQAMKCGSGYTIRRHSATGNQDYFYSATRSGDVVVRTALPYNTSLAHALSVDSVYGYLVVVITLVLTVLAFVASRRISVNVENLRDFAVKAESGDISDYSTLRFPKDELGEISVHIVNLYKRLRQTAEERDARLREVIYEQAEKTRIKQQLTNNINHELKTPVHAIQACLETVVRNGDKIGRQEAMALISQSYDNVRRLSALLADVSVLTRIAEAPEQIAREQVNVTKLVAGVVEQMRCLYQGDDALRMHVDVANGLCVQGNASLLESVFRNLLVNAFTHSGGRDVWLNGRSGDDGYLHFCVYDNGIGVAEEHLSKIFERFYRVDKGRSRAIGGTGLGLSIVKNAVALHGGEITATNRATGGLVFDFTLKQ